MQGFLGTGATFLADLNLVFQMAMGIALLFGMVLARRKKFAAHQHCQTSVVLLNLAMIFLIMAPSFHRQVEPQIPAGLRETYYSVATAHAVLGTSAEVLGLYVILVAATNLIPRRLQFRRYKPWMRATLALWWVVVLFGVGTYYAWYVAPAGQAAPGPITAKADRATVKITNFEFTPKELTVPAGTTLEWVNEVGRHSVEADDGSFKSPTLVAGDRFEHKFEKSGDFPYHCGFHGDKGGKDMAGVIKVAPPAK